MRKSEKGFEVVSVGETGSAAPIVAILGGSEGLGPNGDWGMAERFRVDTALGTRDATDGSVAEDVGASEIDPE